jgi:hypothetical protein
MPGMDPPCGNPTDCHIIGTDVNGDTVAEPCPN